MLAGSAISMRTSPVFDPAETMSCRGESSATIARPAIPLAPMTRIRRRALCDIGETSNFGPGASGGCSPARAISRQPLFWRRRHRMFRLDDKLARIRGGGYRRSDFIIADAKD